MSFGYNAHSLRQLRNNGVQNSVIKAKEVKVMKAVKKKRSEWQNLLRVLRNNAGYLRLLNIREIHLKRITLENIEYDDEENKAFYDRESEKEWRREMQEMSRKKKTPDHVYYATGQRYW